MTVAVTEERKSERGGGRGGEERYTPCTCINILHARVSVFIRVNPLLRLRDILMTHGLIFSNVTDARHYDYAARVETAVQ